jgi:hypothetical protein
MASGAAPTNMQKEQVCAFFADYVARVQIISLMYGDLRERGFSYFARTNKHGKLVGLSK